MIRKLKNLIKGIIFSVIKPPIAYVSVPNTYSQAGEDAIVHFLFTGKKVFNITYLELGVCLPDEGNNTYFFYKNGSRGVCVEADETLIKRIIDTRPEDKVLNVGVGITDETTADFYIFNEPSLNTFSKEEAEFREKHGSYKIQKVAKVQLKTINKLIEENFVTYPQFISIDLEGLDLKVLQTLDFKRFPIPVICVETCTYSENHIKPKDNIIVDFMLCQNYFAYADTYINTIFVNIDWFYEC